jgi:hypothetical protein
VPLDFWTSIPSVPPRPTRPKPTSGSRAIGAIVETIVSMTQNAGRDVNQQDGAECHPALPPECLSDGRPVQVINMTVKVAVHEILLG